MQNRFFMRFLKVGYKDRETDYKNLNVSKRVEYFLHYWNFLFQNNSGLLLIHQEKFESHRSLLEKLELQLTENWSKCNKRVTGFFKSHSYFEKDNILFRKSYKTTQEADKFFKEFEQKWTIKDPGKKEAQVDIFNQFKKIKRLVLRNYINRLLSALVQQLRQDNPIDEKFKNDIHFLINAIIVELYSHGFTIEDLKEIANIIVFPKAHIYKFPFDKTIRDFNENVELFKIYKTETTNTINLHEQIACIQNFIDDNKYPKLIGYCVFNISDFDFQLEKPITIWGVTFYNPQNIRKVKLNKIFNFIEEDRRSDFECIEINFNHLIDLEQNKNINSTCNAMIKVNYRMFNNDNPVISIPHVINKVDKALQVLKKLKRDFVNRDVFVFGRILASKCILLDKEFDYRQFITIKNDYYSFSFDESQKTVFEAELIFINKLYPKRQKLIDLYAYLCQADTDEFAFNFKDFWTVLVEANFPNNPEEFIKKCQLVFRKELNDRLFIDTKIFLNDSLVKKSINLPASKYLLKNSASKQIGLNIPEKRSFDAEKFKSNYNKLKNHLEFDFLDDILDELDECHNNLEEYAKKIDIWLDETIWSVYAERNLETHNNIATDYSLIKLKHNFLYIGKIFLHNLNNKL
ncbi:MAG TPA: hypothetical protein DCG75_17975 [Bacteroidales bacterium]|nr:hypothetical protein [Bacteroidales bacterium]